MNFECFFPPHRLSDAILAETIGIIIDPHRDFLDHSKEISLIV